MTGYLFKEIFSSQMVHQMISRNLFLFSIKGEEFIAFEETRRRGMEWGSLARVALGQLLDLSEPPVFSSLKWG